MLRAVIFDMDGVLLDSEAVHYRVIKKMLEQMYGYQYPVKEFVANCGTPEAEMWPRQLKRAGIEADPEELMRMHRALFREEINRFGIPTFPGLGELLADLKEHGIHLAVASSSSEADITENLVRYGYETFFNAVVSAESCRSGKPSPDVFLLAAKRLDVEAKDCLVVEDSFSGMLAAGNAGMAWVGFAGSSIPADMHYAEIVFSDYLNVTSDDFFQWYSDLMKKDTSGDRQSQYI